MMRPGAMNQSAEQRAVFAADVSCGREKAPELARRGFLSSQDDQDDTAAIAFATYARLPSFNAATQMRPESTP
jgi:hypothetical protein